MCVWFLGRANISCFTFIVSKSGGKFFNQKPVALLSVCPNIQGCTICDCLLPMISRA
uniref:Uncharacterized protein n=1 Tax=uncultured marine virus TaxID=186617 RepID=A0A0F7L8H2_9VIRU|nr:hypothetical protein [uncultured marine virus]